MKVSELQSQLESWKQKYGDLEVLVHNYGTPGTILNGILFMGLRVTRQPNVIVLHVADNQ